MSKIQPGNGYGFVSSGYGFSINAGSPFDDLVQPNNNHPFKIVNASFVTTGGSNKVTFQVRSGTFNNLVPKIDDYITSTEVKLDRTTAGVADPPTAQLLSTNYDSTTKTSYITLRAGPDLASPYAYPDPVVTSNQYPVIIGGNTAPSTPDDNVWGYLVIGTITVDSITNPTTFTVNQNVTGSLWANRIKLGSATARYFYARI